MCYESLKSYTEMCFVCFNRDPTSSLSIKKSLDPPAD
jgi:hypothetical protein